MRATRFAETAETKSLASSGLISFGGSAVSAAMGFALTVVLARTLGDSGSGTVLQVIALFTIVVSLARAGMDSASVWILPRLSASDPLLIRGAVNFLVSCALGIGVLCAAVVEVAAPLLFAQPDGRASDDSQVLLSAARAVGWFIPAASVLLVALAAIRALGSIVPFTAIGSIAVPSVRPVIVWLATMAGGGYVAASLAWAFPLPVAAIAAVAILARSVARHERATGVAGAWRATPSTRNEILRYAAPRTVSAGLEQALIWLDVILVGAMLGPAAAGLYGAASRFVSAGLIVDSALRVVIAPSLSRLLHLGSGDQVQHLYRRATTWLVLFATPIYLLLAIFAPVVLTILGPEFVAGTDALRILSVGAIVTFLAGNVHSVLLMSGRSSWGAANKAVVLAINIAGNVVLLPHIGLVGAAISWTASMIIDAVLALVEVGLLVGVRAEPLVVLRALGVPVLTVGLPALVCSIALGQTVAALLVSSFAGATLFAVACWIGRSPLFLDSLRTVRRN